MVAYFVYNFCFRINSLIQRRLWIEVTVTQRLANVFDEFFLTNSFDAFFSLISSDELFGNQFFDEIFQQIFWTDFWRIFWWFFHEFFRDLFDNFFGRYFLTFLTVGSFRIGVPLILFWHVRYIFGSNQTGVAGLKTNN